MDYKKFLEEVVSYLNEEPSYQDIIDGINKNRVAKNFSDEEKIRLIRDIDNYRYAKLFGEMEVGRALESEDKEKRLFPLFYYSFAELSKEQIDKGINKDNPETARMAFVCRQNICLTPDQIDYILDDESELIRLALVQRKDIELNKNQINKVLKDDSWIVFLTALSKDGVSLTQEQREDGIKRAAMLSYDNADFIREALSIYRPKYQEFSGYGIESEVKKIREKIRQFSIDYVSVLLDNELKNNKLLDSSEEVPPLGILLRYPFAKIDKKYTKYFLNHPDIITKLAFLSRPNTELSDKDVKHILENKLESTFTKLTVINREDITLTSEQINMLLSSEDNSIRRSVIGKIRFGVSEDVMYRGLGDVCPYVKLAFYAYVRAETCIFRKKL